MQISDMLGQYNRNVAAGVETQPGVKGIRQVVSTLSQLAPGNVFEGSINEMKNGQVTLGLPNGQVITARLDAGIHMSVGQTMFFEVKTNNGTQIAIRPFSDGAAGNPTLLSALDAASLPVNARNITMVQSMMQESMAVDKQSLLQMNRIILQNPDVNVQTAVAMTKLGIQVTPELAAQFENYRSDQYAVLEKLNLMMEELPGQLGDKNLSLPQAVSLNKSILEILETGPNMQAEVKGGLAEEAIQKQPMEDVLLHAAGRENGLEGADKANQEGQLRAMQEGNAQQITGAGEQTEEAVLLKTREGQQLMQVQGEIPQEKAQEPAVLSKLFSASQLLNLTENLKALPSLLSNPDLFTKEGQLKEAVTPKQMLAAISSALAEGGSGKNIRQLFSSREYHALLKNVMEQEWLVRPEDLKSDHKINELYDRLDHQMKQMEQVFKAAGANTQSLSQTAGEIRSNVEFMNQLNQTYTYVQLPLKLANQNAHSDLYVYTDKKNLKDPEADLTAFLHLDLDHLGSTDISIRMHQKDVTAKFYLEDDVSYELLMGHIEELEERLKVKGYNASVQVENQKEKVDFVEDFLKKDNPSKTAIVHRYSFDVKA